MKKKFGVLRVTPHLIDDKSWPEIASELAKVFTEQGRAFDCPTGYWHIVGTSELFDEVLEGTMVPSYLAVFTAVEGKPKFLEFRKEFEGIRD